VAAAAAAAAAARLPAPAQPPPIFTSLPAPLRAAVSTPRYKLFVQVVIAEAKGQGIRVASRMLWDPSSDVMASESYTCSLPGKDGEVVQVVASATCHAVYMP
jgi:hypothetical protein